MAQVSLASIRAVVRFRGDIPRSPKFTDTLVGTEIQAAWAELYELIEHTNEGWWDKSTNVTTASSVDFVGLPSDAWKVKAIDRQDGTEWCELNQIGIGDRNRYGATSDEPLAFRLSARGVELFPTPDAVYTLRVTYTPNFTPLDETATVELHNAWDEYIVYSAMIRLAVRQEQPIQELAAMLDAVKRRVITGASRRRQQEPEYLNLRETIDWDWM